MDAEELTAWARAAAFLLGGMFFIGAGALTARLIGPNRPATDKQSPYECGEEPAGGAWLQFNARFYVMGLVFLIFDVEILALFPWVVVFGNERLAEYAPARPLLAFAEAALFVLILAIGLAYVWRNGDIDWIRPAPKTPRASVNFDETAYRAFNRQVAQKLVEKRAAINAPSDTPL